MHCPTAEQVPCSPHTACKTSVNNQSHCGTVLHGLQQTSKRNIPRKQLSYNQHQQMDEGIDSLARHRSMPSSLLDQETLLHTHCTTKSMLTTIISNRTMHTPPLAHGLVHGAMLQAPYWSNSNPGSHVQCEAPSQEPYTHPWPSFPQATVIKQ